MGHGYGVTLPYQADWTVAVAQETNGIPNVAGWWLSHVAARPPVPYPGRAGRC